MPKSHPISQRLQVFLCHSSGDKAGVRALYNRLKRAGFSPWLDERDLIPGQRWDEEIKKAVRQCDIVIVCLSKHSVTKEGYVQKETRFALDLAEEKPEGTIFIIPVLLEDMTIPGRLRDLQYAQLFHKDGYKKLVHALKVRADQVSVNRGDAFAIYRLGLSHMQKQDYREAFRLFEQAAQAGHTGAENYLGVLYNNGLGVPQDYLKAREWHEKAAASGDSYAMYNLGLSHAMGRGVPQDYEQARYWFEKAARGGHPAAMNYLGLLYNNGLGVPHDYFKAKEWHEKAAAAGNSAAMYNLGLSFEKGRGIEQDQNRARHWFEKAAKAGNRNARKRLSEMSKIVPRSFNPVQVVVGPVVNSPPALKWKNIGFDLVLANPQDLERERFAELVCSFESSVESAKNATLVRKLTEWASDPIHGRLSKYTCFRLLRWATSSRWQHAVPHAEAIWVYLFGAPAPAWYVWNSRRKSYEFDPHAWKVWFDSMLKSLRSTEAIYKEHNHESARDWPAKDQCQCQDCQNYRRAHPSTSSL
jgi:TPR repeat protein